jgi:2-dehydropantoate 2-reductase
VRFVIYGAGAVGGTIGGRLAQHGHDVVLIARGAHAAAIRERGLQLISPDEDRVVRVPVVEDPRELALGAGDLVILAMKSQDTEAALAALAPGVTIACAQNGVANEHSALRRFANVIGVYVAMPVAHATPGAIEISCAPLTGILDVGGFPAGAGEPVETFAAALRTSNFDSIVRTDIMRWKYGKLMLNLGNAVEAATGRIKTDAQRAFAERARVEGRAALAAAGIAYVSEAEAAARRGDLLQSKPIAGVDRRGGSSWQSLARERGTIEADYLNGEIVLLGRIHGVPTPVNAMLQRVANQLARDRRPPGSLTINELETLVPAV